METENFLRMETEFFMWLNTEIFLLLKTEIFLRIRFIIVAYPNRFIIVPHPNRFSVVSYPNRFTVVATPIGSPYFTPLEFFYRRNECSAKGFSRSLTTEQLTSSATIRSNPKVSLQASTITSTVRK